MIFCYHIGMPTPLTLRWSLLMALLIGILSPFGAKAELIGSGSLIKASGPAVYFFAGDKRYVFMNESVYRSWFDDFNDVKTITDAGLASLPLGGNVTYRPQTLVKLATDPKVYVIEAPSTLRWVVSEDVARQRFGDDWNLKIEYLSDVQFSDYEVGEPVISPLTSLTSRFFPRSTASLAILIRERAEVRSPDTSTQPPLFLTPPSVSGRTIVSADGYAATSTQSVVELRDWFNAQSSGWTAAYSYVTSTPQGDIGLLSFTRPMGDELTNRSVLLVRSFRSLESGEGTQVVLQEATFPAGYPVYPSAASIFQARRDGMVEHLSITDRPSAEVSAWYRQTLAADGWTSTDITPESGTDSNDPSENVRAEHRGYWKVLEYRIVSLKDIFSTLFAPVPDDVTSFTFITQTWASGVE